ncbi:preprotein translocase subunit SecG [Peptoniphilus sp. KCTC 25270]|uniref:preprotein translocase subunit SecG n=1 Tax=Peptoniphilus sp. KCTC 25270 TaxID=2897414 RepID=UPI001E574058|nr:preprotein translocase subunit SecG [Peptoniphilus sp. KCTC 25270]MCD1147386.1 preprotein translocase subunit SecG [Peptoniphilus sp. KCTC 25270]
MNRIGRWDMTILSILLAISSIVVIVSVVMQESEQVGLGTIDGNVGGGSDWGANRGTSRKEMLKKVTMVSSIVFVVVALAIAAIS